MMDRHITLRLLFYFLVHRLLCGYHLTVVGIFNSAGFRDYLKDGTVTPSLIQAERALLLCMATLPAAHSYN